MQLFLDTADTGDIARFAEAGLLDGVTTNPTLVARTKRPFEEVLKEICSLVDGPISAETVGETAEAMCAQGRELAALHPNIAVKIPLTEIGLKACRTLSCEGIRVNVTLCFSAAQGLLAAKAGATWVSPFVGRLDDVGSSGMGLAADLVRIFANYSFKTQVLVASVRRPEHVVEGALLGAHAATVPPAVLAQLMHHPLTDTGLAQFNKDWQSVPPAKTGAG